jgi:hypothetical protein
VAQVIFPVCSYHGKKPNPLAPIPASGPINLYASAVCLGANGETLEMIYLRPDTTQCLDSLGRLDPTASNSYDPVLKYGVAYFNACDFAWHYALLTSGRAVQAQVDNANPGGNRIFADLIMPNPSITQVPDIIDWLMQHMNIYSALRWNEPNAGGLCYYDWSAQKQQDFRQAFAAAWNHQPMVLDDPSANLANYDTDGTVFDANHAWLLFCAHAAYSLAVEIGGRLPWSIVGYSDADLKLLFHGGSLFRYDSTLNGYSLQIQAVPALPEFTWAFLVSNNLIGTDRLTTIARVLDWCRNNLLHFSGAGTAADMTAHWGYAGHPPVSSVINGTVCTLNPEWGIRHYTAGCWGTTAFLQAVLRTVNIPVESVMGGGHTMPHFTTDNRYLCHGDDPYGFFSKCSPPYDAGLLLIDKATFDGWFGVGVPSATAANNVGRRSTELAVQYLPDGVLHLRYVEIQDGLPPHNGKVYPHFQSLYPNINDLYPDFWQRMDQKLAQFGYADKTFPSVEADFFQNNSPGNNNYELVVRQGASLRHYWFGYLGSGKWNEGGQFGLNVVCDPAMFQNSTNPNYEVVVREGDYLRHYWYGHLSNGTWNKGDQFGENVTGDPAMFQNSTNSHYEVVVREGDHLRHYWYGHLSNGTWNKGDQFGENVTGDPFMFQNKVNHHYEVVVREGDHLRHYWYGHLSNGQWIKGDQFGQNVTGDPVMFQNSDNYHYELVVREGDRLRHYWFGFLSTGTWTQGDQLGENVTGDPAMFHNSVNHHYEVVVREGDHLRHHWFGFLSTGTWTKADRFGENVTSDPVMFQNRVNHHYELVVREGSARQHHWFGFLSDGKWNTGETF